MQTESPKSKTSRSQNSGSAEEPKGGEAVKPTAETAPSSSEPQQQTEKTATESEAPTEGHARTVTRVKSTDDSRSPSTLQIQLDLAKERTETLRLQLQLAEAKRADKEARLKAAAEKKTKAGKEAAGRAEALPLVRPIQALRTVVDQKLRLEGKIPKSEFSKGRGRRRGRGKGKRPVKEESEKEEESEEEEEEEQESEEGQDVVLLSQETSETATLSEPSQKKKQKLSPAPETERAVKVTPSVTSGPSRSSHIPSVELASSTVTPSQSTGHLVTAQFASPNPVLRYLRGPTEKWENLGPAVLTLRDQFWELKPTEVTQEVFEKLDPHQQEIGLSLGRYKGEVRLAATTSNFHTTAYQSSTEYYTRVATYSQPGLPCAVLDDAPYSWAQTTLVELSAAWLAQTNLQVGLLRRILKHKVAGKYKNIIEKLLPILDRLVPHYFKIIEAVKSSTPSNPVRFPEQAELSLPTEALWLGEGLLLAVQSLFPKDSA